MAEPSAAEQLLVELINRARSDPLAEAARFGISLNAGLPAGTISSASKDPLAINPLMFDSAEAHSLWMLATDTFSHTGVDGTSSGGRLTRAGYDWSRAGENISYIAGSSSLISDAERMIESHHRNLFNSSGHRENMLRESYVELGVGRETGLFDIDGTDYPTSMLTEVFATPRDGARFLTGVAIDDRDGDDFYDIGEGLGGVSVTAVGAAGTFSTMTFSAGGYSLELPQGSYSVTFSGGSLGGNVVRQVTMAGGNMKVDVERSDAVTIEGILVQGGAGDDTLTGTRGEDNIVDDGGNNWIGAGDGNDRIVTRGGIDEIRAGGGNDTVRAGAGDDLIYGGFGDDALVADGGNDLVRGGGGADILRGMHGADSLFGEDGVDRLFGWDGRDGLFGGAGDDLLLGQNHGDVLDGGFGNDRLIGGAGRDRFVFDDAFGSDRIDDFDTSGERIDFSQHSGVDRFADLSIRQVGAHTVITDGHGGRLALIGVDEVTISASDFIF